MKIGYLGQDEGLPIDWSFLPDSTVPLAPPPELSAPMPAPMSAPQSSGSSVDWEKLIGSAITAGGQIVVAKEQAKAAVARAAVPGMTDFFGGTQTPFRTAVNPAYSGYYGAVTPRVADNTMMYIVLGGAAFIALALLLSGRD